MRDFKKSFQSAKALEQHYVLLIEKVSPWTQFLCSKLDSFGYEVFHAEDETEAQEMLDFILKSGIKLSAIFSNIDGLESVLSEKIPDVPRYLVPKFKAETFDDLLIT